MTIENGWTSTPITAALVHGAVELEQTERGWLPHRLPARARAQCRSDGQLMMAESQPAGVRLAFRTAATVVELTVVPIRRFYPGAPGRPDGVYDLLVDRRLTAQAGASGGDTIAIDLATGAAELLRGEPGTVRFADLPGREKDVEIWLPYNETTELVGLRTDAPLEPTPLGGRPVWLHHGSSISQGSNAAGPTTTWVASAALAGQVELTGLGFGGSAMLDPFTARAMRDLPADLISVEIGINIVNADAMRSRAFWPAVHGFLDTIRDGHPDVPLVVVSPLYCPIHEKTPGPGAFDTEALGRGVVRFRATGDPAEVPAGKLTLEVIREQLTAIVVARAPEDPRLHLLDGLALYGPDDSAEFPLPDNLHPDAATHRLIADRFRQLAFGPAGPFAR